jgi:hypothetical protein
MLKLTVRTLCSTAHIGLTEINEFPVIDYGRDLKHPGVESHKMLADTL